MTKTKNDIAWEKLFGKYDILSSIERDGYYQIDSKTINEFREARLATKFDHKRNLPKLFKKNKLSILPITRGSYIISSFEAYESFDESNKEITRLTFPDYIESIDFTNITSEAIAINCAFVSGILSDFLEVEELFPTVSGRMSSDEFSFFINNLDKKGDINIRVVNSQIEIDGGYEGENSLALIEAKNSISDDFLIRQLYYPFRLWEGKIEKTVRPIFMVYSNGIFTLNEYVFQEPANYNSLTLIKQKNYTLEEERICLADIKSILDRVKIIEEPRLPFPQADSMKRIINLWELLYNEEMTRDEVSSTYDFDPRQTNYYTDAGRYLGIMDKKREEGEIVYFLTAMGREVFNLDLKTRQLKFIELILGHRAFNKTLKEYFRTGKMPARGTVVEIMKDSNLYRVKSEDTFWRRASSIISWIKWILDLAN